MQFVQKMLVRIGEKEVEATVEVSLPGVSASDHFNAQMLLAAVASQQESMTFVSRHNTEKKVICTRIP